MEQRISEPSVEDIDRLARQYLVIDELASEHLGRHLVNDATDIDVIQALLDARILSPTDTFELQCLGIVLGRRLATALDGVDWCIVEDEYGRDPALRYLKTSLLLFPLTMISKRVEQGKTVDAADMFEQMCGVFERSRREVETR